MASKLFLSLIMIFLLGVSQARNHPAKKILENINFHGMAKLLNQASEDQKIRFFKTSFESFDANKDGFVTSYEFGNVDSDTLKRPFTSLINEAMTEALNKFEQEHENGIDPTKIGITFEDYKNALKRKLEQTYGKKSE